MRAFLFLALLAPIMAFEVKVQDMSPFIRAQPRILEDKITAFLECVRDILKTGDEETGFPSFNPLEVPEITLDLDKLNLQGVNGHVTVKDFHLAGIPDWSLDKLKISITIIPIGAKLIVDVQWPAGDVSGTYDADVTIFGHTAKGAGKIDGDLTKLRIELEGQAVTNPVSVKSAKIKVTLGSSHLVIENLAIDGTDISAAISKFVEQLPKFLVDNEAKINEILKDVIIPAINKVLEAIINGNGETDINDLPIIGKCFPAKKKA